MTVYVCAFGERYIRMMRALEASIRHHIPSATVIAETIEGPGKPGPIPSNHAKLERWVEFVCKTPGRIILLDADMIVNGDLSGVWGDWDAAVTKRTDAPMPYNAGAVYINDTDGARRFIERWWDWELEYINNRDKYREDYKRYAGPNQTALGFLLNEKGRDFTVEILPCAEWNACPDDYHDLARARVIHYKGRMQRFALSDVEMHKVPAEFKAGVQLWRSYDSTAHGEDVKETERLERVNIPSMGAHNIAPWLEEYAENATTIVEIGAWLGHGTEIMARATRGAVHAYDRFTASEQEVRKARQQGVELEAGQDTSLIVRQWLPDNVRLYRTMIKHAEWLGGPIDMLVDDASKNHSFGYVVETFFPHLSDGATVIMQDYHYPPCANQREYMEAHPEFEHIADNKSAALFIYRRPK